MQKRSVLLIVFFTVFLDLLGFGILIPILPFIAEKYGASEIVIGCLMASYSLMQFLFAPVWGRISDRIGRKPIMILSLIGSTTGYALFAIAHSLTLLFVSRILSGIAAANISTSQAIIADTMPPEQRTKGMGLIGAAIGMGFMIGPGVPALFLQGDHYSPVFWVATILSGLDLLMVLFLLPETLNKDAISVLEQRRFTIQHFQQALTYPIIFRLLLLSLIYYIAFSAMESTFGLYILHVFGMNAKQNSWILFAVGVVMVIVQGGFVGRISKVIGDLNMLRTGVAGIAVGLVAMALSPTPWLLITAIIFLAIFSGLANPAMVSLISQLSDEDIQGGMLGLNQSMASMGRIVGPLLGTLVFGFISPQSPFYLSAAMVFIAFVIIFLSSLPETEKAA